VTPHAKRATFGFEAHLLIGLAQHREEHERRGQRSVSAQLDLETRGKPAKLVMIALAHEEGSLGQVVLCGNGLHLIIGQPAIERAHSRGIAAEDGVGEGVDLQEP